MEKQHDKARGIKKEKETILKFIAFLSKKHILLFNEFDVLRVNDASKHPKNYEGLLVFQTARNIKNEDIKKYIYEYFEIDPGELTEEAING